MLTNAVVKAARPRTAAYKLFDQGGLHLYVAPTGRKSFRIKFRLGGKELLLTIGAVPEVSLDAARARCDQVRELLGRGEDPRTCEVAQNGKARAFGDVARQWHNHMRPRWTEVHAGDVLASLERDVFPAVGAMPIGAVTVPVILNVLRLIEERGSYVTASRVRQRISAVFAYAMAHELADQDPAAIVSRVLTPPAPAQHHPALLEIEDVRELLAAAELVDVAPVVKRASRFLALTAVRFAAVRGARWEEIEDLGEDVLFHARQRLRGVARRPCRCLRSVPGARYRFEQPKRFGGHRSLPLFPLDRWIDPGPQQQSRRVAHFPSVLERHVRIAAESQPLLLVAESILHPPRSEAGGRDEQIQAVRVGKLLRLLGLACIPTLRVGQHTVPLSRKIDVPKVPPLATGCP